MFKIEVMNPSEPVENFKYKILCYTYNKNTGASKESYTVSNKTLLEVAQFMKGRGVEYLEDDLLAFFKDGKRTRVYVEDSGKILEPHP